MANERTDDQAVTWPDTKTYLEQVRNGVLDDSELQVGVLQMGAILDVEGEVSAHLAHVIRREANRLRAAASVPQLPEVGE